MWQRLCFLQENELTHFGQSLESWNVPDAWSDIQHWAQIERRRQEVIVVPLPYQTTSMRMLSQDTYDPYIAFLADGPVAFASLAERTSASVCAFSTLHKNVLEDF